jgi:hypothetical protein
MKKTEANNLVTRSLEKPPPPPYDADTEGKRKPDLHRNLRNNPRSITMPISHFGFYVFLFMLPIL